tara:strand:- start:13254 stop:13913 length:660 start_codon:yes stop_codon:yes gene_type:complete
MDLQEFLTYLPKLIGSAVEANQWIGYFAIFIAMFLENLFPPIPSELIMPLGGFYVHQGQLDLLPVVLAGLLGTVLGAFPWYGIGRLVNENRLQSFLFKYGKWIGVSPDDLTRNRIWFNKYGSALVFWGRLIPGIRTLISVPAGIELMPLTPFLVWTTLGSLIWTFLLTFAGYFLGESYTNVETWIAPFSKSIKFIIVIASLSVFILFCIRVLKKLRNPK